MKIHLSILTLGFLLTSPTFAQTTSQKKLERSALDNISLDMEVTTELVQNRETRDVEGTNNFAELNVGYKFDKNNRLVLMNSWTGTFRENKESQFTYDIVQLEYKRRKILSVANDGVDLRGEARLSYTTNDDLREKYGSYGIAEARAYWGLPLGAGFSINKYITYVRAQKYFVREDAPKARDLGWRVRVSPSYRIAKGFDASVLVTYSGYKLNNSDIDEEFEFQPSVRYQYKKLALIVGVEFKPYDTKNGSFKFMDGFEKRPTYSTNLRYFAF